MERRTIIVSSLTDFVTVPSKFLSKTEEVLVQGNFQRYGSMNCEHDNKYSCKEISLDFVKEICQNKTEGEVLRYDQTLQEEVEELPNPRAET